MEIDSDSDQLTKKNAQSLISISSSLQSSLSRLSSSSRAIPSGEDFHFYYNFPEFKAPVKQITTKTDSTLKSIASASGILGKTSNLPEELDEVYDWLVSVNDEVFERFDGCVDEFGRVRKAEEESGMRVGGVAPIVDDDGFQLVCGRKKRGGRGDSGAGAEKNEDSRSSVKAVTRDARTMGGRPRVPFHVPSIVKPQLQFKIVVDNSNEPFQHLWFEKSEDGSRTIHPLEKFSEMDFLDKHVKEDELMKPLALDMTPFKLVEEVSDLKELAAKLRYVDEFAVDLEHNQYRSFQGLTCLMQISTRFEDFVVDTLKLHAHVGPHLREVFKDPSKKKVMHGADRDIVWLQRDFGIYVCNMFDTGQASRALKLERNSLEYLLQHFCGVTANKEYQNADWRVRPIPDEMVKYAREDTHYLLHIYDLMRVRLLEASKDLENVDALLLEVYKRSYDVCMQLYEKDILTDTSYLYIYGLQGLDFNSEQLAVVAGLCEWRDGVARAEDESTGFIMPNKALLEIARQMPRTAGQLRRLVRSNHLYVDRNIGAVVGVIKRSIENASAFESVAEELQKARAEMASVQNTVVADESETLPTAVDPVEVDTVTAQESINMECLNRTTVESAECTKDSLDIKNEPAGAANSTVECVLDEQKSPDHLSGKTGELKKEPHDHQAELLQEKFVHTGQMGAANMKVSNEATVQVLKKPSRAFGALLGKSSSKRKLGSDPKVDVKVEQIQSTVTLPFHSFWGKSDESGPPTKEDTSGSNLCPREDVSGTAATTSLDDVILFENGSNDQESEDVAVENGDKSDVNEMELDTEDKPVALSELKNPKRSNKSVEKPQESEPEPVLQLKPFDYAAAREQANFGGRREKKKTEEEEEEEAGNKNLLHSKERRKNSASSRVPRVESKSEFAPARRRMAFPPTGNRSATFR